MSRTLPKEVSEAIDVLMNATHDWETAPKRGDTFRAQAAVDLKAARLALESAILAWGEGVREGALRTLREVLTHIGCNCGICDRARARFLRPEPEPAGTPSTEDFCTCGHRRGEHNRPRSGACGAREGPHTICDCQGFRSMAPRPWLAPEPAPESKRYPHGPCVDLGPHKLGCVKCGVAPESGGKTCGTCGTVLCCDLPSLAMLCPRCNPAPESEAPPLDSPCPAGWRNGRHEIYLSPGGLYCRACGARDPAPRPMTPEPAGTPLGERDVSLCECGARLRGDVARSTGTCGACRPSPRSETTEDR